MQKTLLAIDVGGSNTRAYLADETGRCLGLGRAPGGNPASNNPELGASAIISAVEAAVQNAALGNIDIRIAMIALAGPVAHVDKARLENVFGKLGLSGPIVFSGDILAMFASMTTNTQGYCVVAGTGAGAIRVKDGEINRAIDASGWLLGDLGSGYWLGHQAAKAAAAEIDERGEPTALTPALLAALDIPYAKEVLPGGRSMTHLQFTDRIYAMRPIQLAQFAPLVFAHRTDPVAAELISQAEHYLAKHFAIALDPEMPGPVAFGGSVIAHYTALPDMISQIIRDAGHEPYIRLVTDGAIGAIVLALRAVGIEVDKPCFELITSSLAELSAKPLSA